MNQNDKIIIYNYLKSITPKLSQITINQMNKYQVSELVAQLNDQNITMIQPPTKYIKPPKQTIEVSSGDEQALQQMKSIPDQYNIYLARFLFFLSLNKLQDNEEVVKTIRIAYQIPKKALDDVLSSKLYEYPLKTYLERNQHVCHFVNVSYLVGFFILFQSSTDDESFKLLFQLIGDDQEISALSQQKLIYAMHSMQFIIDDQTLQVIELLFCRFIISKLLDLHDINEIIFNQDFKFVLKQNVISTACILNIENMLSQHDCDKYIQILRLQTQIREDCIQLIKQQIKPIIHNYVAFYATDQQNFNQFLLLFQFIHCCVNKKSNFNEQTEKIITQAVIKQFQALSLKYDFSVQKKNNVQQFIQFISDFKEEIDCQLAIFLPEIDKYYCTDCFISKDFALLSDQYVLNEMLFPGTSNQKFTASEGLTVSVFTVFAALSIILLNQSIQLIVKTWYLENGQLQRINISQFREVCLQIQTIILTIYDVLLNHNDDADKQRVVRFLGPGLILQITSPLTKQILQSEFDFCKHIISNAAKNEQLVEITVTNSQYLASSIAIDAIQLLTTILQQIIEKINFSDTTIHAVYAGFFDILACISSIYNSGLGELKEIVVENLFDQQSAKLKFGQFISPANQPEPSQSDSIQNREISLLYQKDETRARDFFTEKNKLFDNFQVRKERNSVFKDFPFKEGMQSIFDIIDYFSFRINALYKLQLDFEAIFQQIRRFKLYNDDQMDNMVNLFNTSSQKSQQEENQAGKRFEGRILMQLSKEIELLSKQMSKMLIIKQLPIIQQVYTPNPSICNCAFIIQKLRQILSQLRQCIVQPVKKQVIIQYCKMFSAFHYLILADSSQRSRTICANDFPILSQDFSKIIDIMKNFLEDQEVKEILERNLKVIQLHGKETQELLRQCCIEKEQLNLCKMEKSIDEIKDNELAIRVINFRRYCDEEAHQFMIQAKKEAQ